MMKNDLDHLPKFSTFGSFMILIDRFKVLIAL